MTEPSSDWMEGETRECPRCGWKALGLVEPITGEDRWLCSNTECGRMMDGRMEVLPPLTHSHGADDYSGWLKDGGAGDLVERDAAQQRFWSRRLGLAGESTY